MTPEELYHRYKGRRAREEMSYNPCEGIIVGYSLPTNNPDDDDYPLIIEVTNGSRMAWHNLEHYDVIVDNQNTENGWQYIKICEITFKFGR